MLHDADSLAGVSASPDSMLGQPSQDACCFSTQQWPWCHRLLIKYHRTHWLSLYEFAHYSHNIMSLTDAHYIHSLIIWMRELRPEEVKSLVQGHTDGGKTRNRTQAPQLMTQCCCYCYHFSIVIFHCFKNSLSLSGICSTRVLVFPEKITFQVGCELWAGLTRQKGKAKGVTWAKCAISTAWDEVIITPGDRSLSWPVWVTNNSELPAFTLLSFPNGQSSCSAHHLACSCSDI